MAKKPGWNEVACSKCKEPMAVDAKRCPHCTTIFTDDEVAKRVAHLRGAKRLLFGFLGVAVFVLILVDHFDDKKVDAGAVEPPRAVASDQTVAPEKPVDFKAEWLPKAQGVGNFEVCLSDQAAENDVKDVTLPVGTMFESWGHLTGPLRDDEAHLQESAHITQTKDQYSVALTEKVRLTLDKPCRITQARTVLDHGFRFVQEVVPASKHFSFSGDGLYLDKNGGVSNDQKGSAGNAALIGVLFGTPTADIGNPYQATDD